MYVTPDSNYTKCILGHQNILNDFRFHQNYKKVKGRNVIVWEQTVASKHNNILNYIRNNNNKMLLNNIIHNRIPNDFLQQSYYSTTKINILLYE
jgi:hypothetical protein